MNLLAGRTRGLLGTWNDDDTDDLQLADGTTLSDSASPQSIYSDFGESCNQDLLNLPREKKNKQTRWQSEFFSSHAANAIIREFFSSWQMVVLNRSSTHKFHKANDKKERIFELKLVGVGGLPMMHHRKTPPVQLHGAVSWGVSQ